ncbi:MAG: histidine--tRNA ligase [Bacteroidota bacterium]
MPNTPKGTRDFLPDVVRKRNYIFGTIRQVFEKYGYQPIETPAMENLESLTGKYGEEGDRLIFKIVESGESVNKEILTEISKLEGNSPATSKEFSVVIKSRLIQAVNESLQNSSGLLPSSDFFVNSIIGLVGENAPRYEKTKVELLAKAFRSFLKSESVYVLNGLLNIQEVQTRFEHLLKLHRDQQADYENELNQFVDFFVFKSGSVALILELYERFDENKLSKGFSKKALRYDLTVPFARFVVQHQNELSFPFRRYQIQPVWRADRPQKGRYREFFQCDADVVGTDSLRCEVEYCQIFDEVFTKLGLPVEIRLNNRKLLAALAEYIGEKDRLVQMTIAIDKLDKMPLEKVLEDLRGQEFPEDALEKLKGFLEVAAKDLSNGELLDEVSKLLGESEEGTKGVEELRFILAKVESLGLDSAKVVLDLSLARGLNYYTGAIFEVRPLTENQVGSICGGGRYDDLTGIFGMKGMSGVGISFGADRIYDLLEAESKFPEKETEGTKLLFVNFGEPEADYCHQQLVKIRKVGIRAELYPDSAKMKKQMKYANDKQIPFVALVGENEIERGSLSIKDMTTGEQLKMSVDELIKKLS